MVGPVASSLISVRRFVHLQNLGKWTHDFLMGILGGLDVNNRGKIFWWKAPLKVLPAWNLYEVLVGFASLVSKCGLSYVEVSKSTVRKFKFPWSSVLILVSTDDCLSGVCPMVVLQKRSYLPQRPPWHPLGPDAMQDGNRIQWWDCAVGVHVCKSLLVVSAKLLCQPRNIIKMSSIVDGLLPCLMKQPFGG